MMTLEEFSSMRKETKRSSADGNSPVVSDGSLLGVFSMISDGCQKLIEENPELVGVGQRID
jgi:hypothetical protein